MFISLVKALFTVLYIKSYHCNLASSSFEFYKNFFCSTFVSNQTLKVREFWRNKLKKEWNIQWVYMLFKSGMIPAFLPLLISPQGSVLWVTKCGIWWPTASCLRTMNMAHTFQFYVSENSSNYSSALSLARRT